MSRIADEYESDAFPIFRVIHTENRGLSAARNLGISEAKADWLMFVDSDDWVEPRFCEIPYEAAKEVNADMVVFQNYNTTENGRVRKQKHGEILTGLIDSETAIDVGGTPAWNKLYRIGLFDDIRYPEGHVFEDYAVTHQLIYNTRCIVSLPFGLYFYRYRKGSICHSFTGENDRLEFSKSRYLELVGFGYDREKAEAQLMEAALRCCGRTNKSSSTYKEANKLLENVKGIPKYLSPIYKFLMAMWRFNKDLYKLLFYGYLRIVAFIGF